MREALRNQVNIRNSKKLVDQESIEEDGKLLVKIFKEAQQTTTSINHTERDKQLVKKAVAFIKQKDAALPVKVEIKSADEEPNFIVLPKLLSNPSLLNQSMKRSLNYQHISPDSRRFSEPPQNYKLDPTVQMQVAALSSTLYQDENHRSNRHTLFNPIQNSTKNSFVRMLPPPLAQSSQGGGSSSQNTKVGFNPVGPSLATIFQSLENITKFPAVIPQPPQKKASPSRVSPQGLNPAMLSTATILGKDPHGKVALKKSKTIMSNKAQLKSPSSNRQSNRGRMSDDKKSGQGSIAKKKAIENGTPEVFTGWNNNGDFQQTRNYFYMTNKNFNDLRNKTIYPED